MKIEIRREQRKLKWKHILSLAGFVLLAGWFLLDWFPAQHKLVIFGLYSIPSHMLISPFAHEPALFYAAKFYPPWQIALAGTIGCTIAGLFDYWLLLPLLHHKSLRPKLDNKRLFQKAMAFFKKSPFWFLVVAGFSPVPFYPFKFLSIAGGYPLWKYESALVIGRAPRYYTLAYLGYILQVPTWLLIALFVFFLMLPIVQRLFFKKSEKSVEPIEESDQISIDIPDEEPEPGQQLHQDIPPETQRAS